MSDKDRLTHEEIEKVNALFSEVYGKYQNREIARLREENAQLKYQNDILFGALGATLRLGLPPHDVSGSRVWSDATKVWQEVRDYRLNDQIKTED